MKWSDWQAEMSDGFAFKRSLENGRQKDPCFEPAWTQWPVEAEQVLVRTEDGRPPAESVMLGTGEWERVWRLADVENLYDLGFWRNLKHVFWPMNGLRRVEKRAQESGGRPVAFGSASDSPARR